MKAWKVLTILMVVALGVAMSAQAGMTPGNGMMAGTPGDFRPDIYIDVVPDNYSSADAIGGTVFVIYTDPDVDSRGIWVDWDNTPIGNNFGATAMDPTIPLFAADNLPGAGGPNPAAVIAGITELLPGVFPVVAAAVQTAGNGNTIQQSATFSGPAWGVQAGIFGVGYSDSTDTSTFDGTFWLGDIIDRDFLAVHGYGSLYDELEGGLGLLKFTYQEPGGAGAATVMFDLITPDPIPEPSTIVLLASAALGLVLLRRRS